MRSMPLKVCLVSTEILGWGLAGGFGFATRSLGRELARRGVDVHVVSPYVGFYNYQLDSKLATATARR